MSKRGNGEGTIAKRPDGRWAAALRLPDGRRQWFYGKERRSVQEKLLTAARNLQQGISPATNSRQTVAQFLSHWLDTVAEPGVRPLTLLRYRSLVNHVLATLGKRPLQKLTPQDLQTLYSQKLAEGLSPRSVGHIHRVLHRALSHAVRWNLVPRNVCDLVDPPRAAKPEVHALNPEQARSLLAAAQGDALEAVYVLALTTGLRRGELIGLKWGDVDLDGASLQVRRSLTRLAGKGWVEMEPKSATSRRKVALTPLAVQALNKHRVLQLQARLLASTEWEDHDLVFCNAFGRPIEGGNLLRRSFSPLLKKAGLPHIRFHDLRHSAASLMLSLGAHPKIVQDLLGHSQIGVTMDTYSHTMPTLQREAVGKLNDLLESQG